MKKIILFAAICASVLASCGNQNKGSESALIDSLQNIIDQKDNEINEMMGQFNDIQEGFSLINQAEGRVNLMAENAEGNGAKDNIRENMEFIQQTLSENKKKIDELEKKLKSSSINTSKMKEAIAKLTEQLNTKNKELEVLRAELAEKNIQIAVLNENIESLTSENTEVKQQRDESQQLASQQEIQLNTAYYVYGTSKELKAHNILKSGDVLKGDFDKSYFVKIDIRNTQVIPLESKSAKILTNHPSGTYSLMKDTKGIYSLRITDPDNFWATSKYLVIQVK